MVGRRYGWWVGHPTYILLSLNKKRFHVFLRDALLPRFHKEGTDNRIAVSICIYMSVKDSHSHQLSLNKTFSRFFMRHVATSISQGSYGQSMRGHQWCSDSENMQDFFFF